MQLLILQFQNLAFVDLQVGFEKQYHVIPDGEGKMNMGKQRDVFYL